MSTDWTVPTVIDAGGDEGLSAVLAEYLAALDRGEHPDRDALLRRHPHLADQMRAFFDGGERLDHLAGPLRVPATGPPLPEAAGAVPFDLLEEIGRGGMGVVLRARDPVLDRELAVKVLLDHFCTDPDLVRRFVEEARITGRLQHPFIVPVHKLGALPDGRPYFAMKLIQGRTLAELLAERSHPAHDRLRFLKVFEQVCQTLAYVHSKGVIHRDLKPANVMVGAFGEVQVMDWGLAKALGETRSEGDSQPGLVASSADQTQAGSVLGTLAYMPPEQASGEVARIDRRSDVFGLGAILCEILTGQPPYIGAPAEVQEKARGGQTREAGQRLQDCGADRELIDLAQGCLAADPQMRPSEAGAVADSLASYFAAAQERLRAAEIARAKAETEAVEEHKRVILAEAKAVAERRRRRATLLMAASLLLLVAGAATFGLWYQGQRAEQAARSAARRATTERDATAALGEVRLLHEEGLKLVDAPDRWRTTLQAAWSALKRAEEAVERGEPTDDLRQRVAIARAGLEQDDRDHRLFAELDRLHLEGTVLSIDDVRLRRDCTRQAVAFRAYGLDLNVLDPAEAADQLARNPHRDRLLDEIEIWAQFEAAFAGTRPPRNQQKGFRGVAMGTANWARADRLLRVLDAAEPDPASFRRQWRAAREARDVKRLVALAGTSHARALSSVGVCALANDLMLLRALDEAWALLQRAQERNPRDLWLNYYLGMLAPVTGRPSLDQALRYLTAALATRGNQPMLHIQLSACLKLKGDLPEALRAAEAAVAADPDSAPAHQNLGIIRYEMHDLDGSLPSFQKAADLDAKNPYALDALGQTYGEMGLPEKAIACFQAAIRRDPSYSWPYVNLGNVLAFQRKLSAALEQYDKALKLFPDFALAHCNRGHVLRAQGQFQEAIASYRKAIQCDPDLLVAHYSLGATCASRGDAAGALEAYQGPVERNERSPEAHFQLAQMQEAFGRLSEAEAGLRKALELNPTHLGALRNLGNVLLTKRDWTGAVRYFSAALEVNYLDPKIHDNLGIALFYKNDLDGAIFCHRTALDLDPDLANAYHNLGVALRAKGDPEAAADVFREAIRLNPKAARSRQFLGEALFGLRERDEAIEQLQAAIGLDQKNVEAHVSLAIAQLDRGDYKAALVTLQQGQGQLAFLDSRGGDFRRLIAGAELFVELEKKLPAVLRREVQPADAQERLVLGHICSRRKRDQHAAAAAGFFADAFQAEPALADNLQQLNRYLAACSAVFAGTGRSADGATLPAAKQTELRRQGLTWLRADLDAMTKGLTSGPPQLRVFVRNMLRHWLRDPELACVRDPAELLGLPTEEREDWFALWDDVSMLRQKASE